MSHLIQFDADPEALAEQTACCSSGLACDDGGGGGTGEPTDFELLCEKITELQEALCQKLEALSIPNLSGYQQLGCVTEGEGKNKTIIGHVGVCKVGTEADPTFVRIMFPTGGGEPVVGYGGPVEKCPTDPNYILSECFYETNDPANPLCGLPIYVCPETPGIPYILNPTTLLFEVADMTDAKVGKNNPDDNICIYPFECEITGDGSTAITPATILADQAGAVYPGTTIAVDGPESYLHEYSITLGHEGDESADTESATGCDAIHTTVATAKEINMEPGGKVGTSVPPGNDVPEFSNVPSADSVVRVCGAFSVKKSKDGTAIAKPGEG